ncbi:exosortase A [Rhodoferax sp.]|uniref:exosortase A n=1 Tax=Rhodoferax sp. TaxID=50421 RepID=UPI00374DBE1A
MNHVPRAQYVPKTWLQSILVFLALLILISLFFQDTFLGMVSIWLRSETFTHGFFVAPIVIWLVWRKREIILFKTPKVNFWFLIPIAAAILLWVLGNLAFVNSVTQLSAVALIVLLVPAVFGWAIAAVILFPLLFLFFSVPLGEFLFPQLMEWTANFTVSALRLSGVPVYREGLQFVIPSGNWSVVEACSGVRYLIASVTVGTLFAYLNYQSFRRRLLFIMVSIIVPILANWMRAYLIVMLGHFSGNKLAVGVDHIIYGWLFFGLVIILMFMVGARWAEAFDVTVVPTNESQPSAEKFSALALITLFFVTAAFISLPYFSDRLIFADKGLRTPATGGFLTLKEDWKILPASAIELRPIFRNASFEINNVYSKDDNAVGLYLAYYHGQSYEKKLVSSDNVLIPSNDQRWASVGVTEQAVDVHPVSFSAKSTELRDISVLGQRTDDRLIAWQFYWINGMLTANDHLAKIYSIWQRFLGRGDDSAVIVLYTDKKTADKSVKLLHEFLDNNLGAIESFLQSRSN